MDFFNQSVTRNVVVSFMDFFSRFSIEKFSTISVSGGTAFAQRKVIPVPIQYATREKWVEIVRSSSARKAMDPAIRDRNPVEMQWILPRISCNITGINFDASRRLIKTQKIDDFPNLQTTNNKSATYSPASYNLSIEIATISRTLDENLQLMEQIIPFFSPSLSMTLNLYPDKEPESVTFVLESTSFDNPTDIPEFEERFFTMVYNFNVRLNYYMPKKSKSIINGMTINMVNGQEVIALDKSWVEASSSISNKLNAYIANSNLVNPLIVTNLNSSNALATLGSLPSVSALQNEPEHTISLSYSNYVSGGDYTMFDIWYKVDNDIEPKKYVNPIPITFNKIFYWVNMSLNPVDNASLEMYEYTVI